MADRQALDHDRLDEILKTRITYVGEIGVSTRYHDIDIMPFFMHNVGELETGDYKVMSCGAFCKQF